MNIALLTYEGRNPEMYDEEIVAEELRRLGARAEWVVWDRLEDPEAWDAIVFRSTWDYVEKLPEFRAFLERLRGTRRARVFNAPDLMLWNLSKSYLEELEREGVPVLPTLTLSGAVPEALARLRERFSEGRVVLKPQISAGAFRTQVLDAGDTRALTAYLAEGLRLGSVMAQPYVDTISTDGEVSLLYWNSRAGIEFSHSVGKTPAPGDFRVQKQWGGITVPWKADAESRALGERLLSRFDPEDWLYARVDLVRHEGAWRLIELEMIEPFLFFPYAPAAARKFAEVTVGWMR